MLAGTHCRKVGTVVWNLTTPKRNFRNPKSHKMSDAPEKPFLLSVVLKECVRTSRALLTSSVTLWISLLRSCTAMRTKIFLYCMTMWTRLLFSCMTMQTGVLFSYMTMWTSRLCPCMTVQRTFVAFNISVIIRRFSLNFEFPRRSVLNCGIPGDIEWSIDTKRISHMSVSRNGLGKNQ